MGIEYRISCSPNKLQNLTKDLVLLGGRASGTAPTHFEFSSGLSSSSNPDVTVIVEGAGIYFCEHGGDREKASYLFRRIVDKALTYSDSSDSVLITSL